MRNRSAVKKVLNQIGQIGDIGLGISIQIGFFDTSGRGTALEEVDRVDEASRLYAEFLHLWREGDQDIPELKDAAIRLDRLRHSP
ncbi:MAG: hypothetical protein P1R58_00680 [bacterium]|nr:hypothetical protein [bacterium]